MASILVVDDNEIFQDLNIGDNVKGYVKKVREDGKIDLSLHKIGYKHQYNLHLPGTLKPAYQGSLSISQPHCLSGYYQ